MDIDYWLFWTFWDFFKTNMFASEKRPFIDLLEQKLISKGTIRLLFCRRSGVINLGAFLQISFIFLTKLGSSIIHITQGRGFKIWGPKIQGKSKVSSTKAIKSSKLRSTNLNIQTKQKKYKKLASYHLVSRFWTV